MIDAVEAEEGFAVREIDFVFHPALPRDAGRVEVIHGDAKRFEFWKFFGQGGRIVDPFVSEQAIFGPGI
jgi:hypothetical protein